MNAAHLHVALVHLPVVGVFFIVALLALSLWLRSDLLLKTACGFTLLSAAGAAGAYFSGGYAYDLMKPDLAEELVENHAVIGRAFFVVMVLCGLLAAGCLAQFLQEETPAPALRWSFLLALLVCVWTGAWAAHLGGLMRHPEIGGVRFLFFPDL